LGRRQARTTQRRITERCGRINGTLARTVAITAKTNEKRGKTGKTSGPITAK
jgi:hypothetical protein